MHKDKNISSLMLAAPASGSGKTLLTCGLLQALLNRKLNIASFKCGPDYIDPMFHEKVLGTKSRNLDLFLSGEGTVKYLFSKHAKEADFALLEGVMGYYDGVGNSTWGSAYELAEAVGVPVVLVVNARGMSLSVAALIKGFLEFRHNSHIKGVILNQLSPMLYGSMKENIERETGVRVYGYLPVMKACEIESRHLGLLLPEEINDFKSRINNIAQVMEETLDIEGLLCLAQEEEGLPEGRKETVGGREMLLPEAISGLYNCFAGEHLSIAYTRDEAFCFCYEDNLELLCDLGVTLYPFSPLYDEHLPKQIHGLLLFGGYPELYGKKLSQNITIRNEIRDKILSGLPTMAECGGFLYLLESLQEKDSGKEYPMAGVFPGSGYDGGKLVRFGYVELKGGKAFGRDVGRIRAHEFHHYDTKNPGSSFLAEKPLSHRSWQCIHSSDTIFAGFPHQYFYGNLKLPEAFLSACREFQRKARER